MIYSVNSLKPSDTHMRQWTNHHGSDNALSPGRRQSIIWPNVVILLIGSFGINFSEISSKIDTFSSKKMHFKMSSGNGGHFCLGLNVLTKTVRVIANDDPPGCPTPPTKSLWTVLPGADLTLTVLFFQQVAVRKPLCINQPNKFCFKGHILYC